jgi:hypothetical protein
MNPPSVEHFTHFIAIGRLIPLGPVALSNALVQLQARYHHCGEAHPKSACLLQRSLDGRLRSIRCPYLVGHEPAIQESRHREFSQVLQENRHGDRVRIGKHPIPRGIIPTEVGEPESNDPEGRHARCKQSGHAPHECPPALDQPPIRGVFALFHCSLHVNWNGLPNAPAKLQRGHIRVLAKRAQFNKPFVSFSVR